MALCPFAKHLLIPPGVNDPRIKARAAILHVAASMATSLFSFFRDRSGGIESHFYVTWTGKIEQYRDTAYQADANLDANDFAISIETAGLGRGKWNPLQLHAIKRLLRWCADTHHFPLQKIKTWDGTGVGYHTQFGAPSHWTPVVKTCPGPDRVKQFNAELVPWMTATSAPKPKPQPPGRLGSTLLMTANLGRGVSEAKFLDNLRAIDAEATHRAIIGFQEIDEDDAPAEHAGLRRILGDTFKFAGAKTRVPVVFGSQWTFRRQNVVAAAPGLARLSPARVVTEAVLVGPGGFELAFLDVHFPRNDPRLLSRWRSTEAVLRRRIAAHAKHRPVVWVGDVNRTTLGSLHPRERTLAHQGLDWIRYVEHPAGVQLEAFATGAVNLTIDGHNAPWVRVHLTAPKETR